MTDETGSACRSLTARSPTNSDDCSASVRNNNVRVLPVAAIHVAAIVEMIKELAEFEKFPDGPTLTEAQLSHDIEHGHVYGFIAFVDEHTPAGMTLYYMAYSTWEGQYIHMEDLYVRPRYRRIGIARALCRAIAQVANERNMKRMQWNVLNWNKGAIKMYEQMAATNLHDSEGWITYRLTPTGIERLANVD